MLFSIYKFVLSSDEFHGHKNACRLKTTVIKTNFSVLFSLEKFYLFLRSNWRNKKQSTMLLVFSGWFMNYLNFIDFLNENFFPFSSFMFHIFLSFLNHNNLHQNQYDFFCAHDYPQKNLLYVTGKMRIHNHFSLGAKTEIHNSMKLSVKLFMRRNQAYAKKICRNRPASEMCGKKEMPVIVVGNDYWIFWFLLFCLPRVLFFIPRRIFFA